MRLNAEGSREYGDCDADVFFDSSGGFPVDQVVLQAAYAFLA